MEIATPLPEQSAEKYKDKFFKDSMLFRGYFILGVLLEPVFFYSRIVYKCTRKLPTIAMLRQSIFSTLPTCESHVALFG